MPVSERAQGRSSTVGTVHTLAYELTPTPPFRLDLTVWALRRRADNAVDGWDGEQYRRVFTIGEQSVMVAVRQVSAADSPRLQVDVRSAQPISKGESLVTSVLERVVGLRLDLADFYRVARTDPQLAALADRFRGLKPPRFPTLFETLANAIACQQVTLTLGVRLLNGLASAYGPTASTEASAARGFPRPIDLASCEPEDLRALAFSHQKGRALVELARGIVEGRVDLEGLASQDNATVVEQLQQLRGVGRWSAEYVLLRGLGRLDVFPGDDVGARNNLRRWLGLATPLDYEGVRHTLAAWQPYGGLVYLHLLLDSLAAAGHVQP